MKNKKLYKYYLISLGEILIASILSLIIAYIIKKVLSYLYINTGSNFIFYFWEFVREIRRELGVEYFNIIIGTILFTVFYFMITSRKAKNLIAIIDETETMSNGDLDRIIEIESEGDMKKLAENINNISRQLKDITVAERNAQKTKNDLITNVSHDLRTPLTSIIGYLELIDNDKYKDEVELRYYVNIVYEKSKSLNLLINELFQLTKMQNNTINLDKTDINLVELLGQVVACFECQFNSADMQSRIKFSKDKLIINADAGKLVRAFENLLSNSIKYGKDGYYVDVITKIEKNMAVVQVINYGQSISSIDLPYIFDRFYRVEKSRNSSIGGSGLGLAITKNIIELHNGTIQAYSDDNRTIFEVKLPVK
ncbi:sensor histidine kinase [Clostridium weizhouense]|uniref:histidine kinase n=1 Tax=Clostridium weizhouense TaxID=2859781 RepID=A0ABS7AQN2_9CLOT|nr:HAMP domain-containing sensor histidine kinase [Clostridium weizhouense]MBW6410978.1 HAMP domain-containing histidine kinase [Clostridium weizhouense]